MSKSVELFKKFYQTLTGNTVESDKEYFLDTVDDLENNYEVFGDEDFGSLRLYSLFRAVGDLIEEEVKEQTGNRPRIRVIDRMWDAKDAEGVLFDLDRYQVLTSYSVAYPTTPWGRVENIASVLAEIYNSALKRVKEVYGVELEEIPTQLVEEQVRKFVESIRKEVEVGG